MQPIDRDKLQQLFAADAQLVQVLSPPEYEEEHLTGDQHPAPGDGFAARTPSEWSRVRRSCLRPLTGIPFKA